MPGPRARRSTWRQNGAFVGERQRPSGERQRPSGAGERPRVGQGLRPRLLRGRLAGRRPRAPGRVPVSYTHLTLPTICSV
eukprot:3476594-Alexandrium_andersonii.AAC.1